MCVDIVLLLIQYPAMRQIVIDTVRVHLYCPVTDTRLLLDTGPVTDTRLLLDTGPVTDTSL